MRIALAPLTDIVDVTTKSNVSDFTTLPQAKDFKVEITDSRDNVTPVANIGDVVTLPAGNYSASAVYGSLSDEGFDKPCFKGSQTFTVTGGQTGDVKITVKLAGSIVRLHSLRILSIITVTTILLSLPATIPSFQSLRTRHARCLWMHISSR